MGSIYCLLKNWKRISLIDRYLINIMCILIIFSVATIYIGSSDVELAKHIDVIMRSNIASIFGYFVSSNFVKDERVAVLHTELDSIQSTMPLVTMDSTNKESTTKSQIGFTAGDATSDTKKSQVSGALPHVETSVKPPTFTYRNIELQIRVVGFIAQCAILIVIIVRFVAGEGFDETATIATYRDIICGSIGFLIGMPSESHK